MRLKHITFTGVDARTDIERLKKIQECWPLAEFGVLTSYHWYENGNRYINPQFLCNLWGQRLNLALHVCGRAASDAADGYWYRLCKHLNYCLGLFKRVQLNIANRADIPYRLASTPYNHTEVIIQQRGIHDIEFYERSKWVNTSILLDASGGQGINTPIEILKCDGKVGYAGGINAENVADKLRYLFENVRHGEFWIDMESGVRTDDWLDLDKVERVLRICDEVIKKYKED